MGILMVLGVVNLRSTQINGRDDERKADIATIGLNLEAYYKLNSGRYPSQALIGQEQTMLPDIDPKSLSAPGSTSSSLLAGGGGGGNTATILPSPLISTYVYEPIQADGTVCANETQECRKFYLYYQLEGDNTIYVATSKNQ